MVDVDDVVVGNVGEDGMELGVEVRANAGFVELSIFYAQAYAELAEWTGHGFYAVGVGAAATDGVEGYCVAQVDELFDEKVEDALGAAVASWGHGLEERGYECDTHVYWRMEDDRCKMEGISFLFFFFLG